MSETRSARRSRPAARTARARSSRCRQRGCPSPERTCHPARSAAAVSLVRTSIGAHSRQIRADARSILRASRGDAARRSRGVRAVLQRHVACLAVAATEGPSCDSTRRERSRGRRRRLRSLCTGPSGVAHVRERHRQWSRGGRPPPRLPDGDCRHNEDTDMTTFGVSADTPLETELTFMPSGRMLALARMDGTDAELLGDQGRLRTKRAGRPRRTRRSIAPPSSTASASTGRSRSSGSRASSSSGGSICKGRGRSARRSSRSPARSKAALSPSTRSWRRCSPRPRSRLRRRRRRRSSCRSTSTKTPKAERDIHDSILARDSRRLVGRPAGAPHRYCATASTPRRPARCRRRRASPPR